MADKVQFELVSPERLLLSEAVDMVVVPGTEGNFGVLPGHAPLISSIRPGVIDVYQAGTITERIFISGGFAEVANNRCTVLADMASGLDKLDRTAAETELNEARDHLAGLKDGSDAAALARAERAVAVATAKLDAARAPAA